MIFSYLFLGLALGLSPQAVAPGSSTSPDGLLTVFECPKGNGVSLCLKNSSGKTRQLINLPGRNKSPKFSPDGLFIAFIADLGVRQIVSVTDLSGHSWPVADVTGAGPIEWSPDGVWLVFSANRRDGNKDILQITAGGTNYCWLTNSPDVDEINPVYISPSRIGYNTSQIEVGGENQQTLSFPNDLTCRGNEF